MSDCLELKESKTLLSALKTTQDETTLGIICLEFFDDTSNRITSDTYKTVGSIIRTHVNEHTDFYTWKDNDLQSDSKEETVNKYYALRSDKSPEEMQAVVDRAVKGIKSRFPTLNIRTLVSTYKGNGYESLPPKKFLTALELEVDLNGRT